MVETDVTSISLTHMTARSLDLIQHGGLNQFHRRNHHLLCGHKIDYQLYKYFHYLKHMMPEMCAFLSIISLTLSPFAFIFFLNDVDSQAYKHTHQQCHWAKHDKRIQCTVLYPKSQTPTHACEESITCLCLNNFDNCHASDTVPIYWIMYYTPSSTEP